MVRINDALIADVKGSRSAVAYMSTSGAPMDISVTYDTNLGGLSGTVRTNGQTLDLRPLSAEQRLNPECGIQSQRTRINLFHTITVQTGRTSLPSLPYLLQPLGLGFPTCCQGATKCTRVRLNQAALSQSTLRLPGNGDSGVVFVLAVTAPRNCQGLCDLYYYRGQKTNGQLKISPQENIYELQDGSSLFHLSKCGHDLIWSDGEKGGAANDISKGETKNPAAPGRSGSGTVGNSDCWYNQTKYCNQDYNQVAAPIVAQGINCEQMSQFCHDQCLQIPNCNYFTFYQSRLTARCHFLSSCVEVRSASCLHQENCLSGASQCSAAHGTGCTGPIQMDYKFTPWTCTDRYGVPLADQHAAIMPLNTICVQRCNNWIDNQGHPGYLQSICQDSGVWSETRVQNGDASLQSPASPYAEPDDHLNTAQEPFSVCSCDPLTLRWPPNDPNGFSYDPNLEEGAKFICDIPVSNSSGPIVISPGNECRLFCDNHHFVTVTCADAAWTGHVDTRGIWCYTRPDGNGTCGANCIGTWMSWGEWSSCDMSNSAQNGGLGQRHRTRPCSGGICEGAPQNGIETETCNEWSAWSACDGLTGTRTRTRAGGDTDTENCDVDGQWGAWGNWGACASSGIQTRSRVCNNPQQWHNGAACIGLSSETTTCPVDGGYSEWTQWTTLDETTWTQTRSRTCDQPTPLHNGLTCIQQNLGDALETRSSSVTVTVTAKRIFYNTVVPDPFATDLSSGAQVVGGASGIFTLTIASPGSYSYTVGNVNNLYHPITWSLDMNCAYSSCQTTYTVNLYKRHPMLQQGEIAINLYWLTNAEDLDLNIMTVPRNTSEAVCRQYWGRNVNSSPPRCPGILHGSWKTGIDCKLPDGDTAPCNEYIVVDATAAIDYGIGPEDSMIFKGADITIETTDRIEHAHLETQVNSLPTDKSGWFVGCVWGPGMVTSFATSTTAADGSPTYGQSPVYISHEVITDWVSAMQTWCTASTGVVGRQMQWNKRSFVDRYDFDCDKRHGPCH